MQEILKETPAPVIISWVVLGLSFCIGLIMLVKQNSKPEE
jgi:hypothetical protein